VIAEGEITDTLDDLLNGGTEEKGGEKEEEEGGGVESVDSRLEMYMCQYCHQLMWTIDEIREHLRDSHPEEPPEFELIQQPPKKKPAATGSGVGMGGGGSNGVDGAMTEDGSCLSGGEGDNDCELDEDGVDDEEDEDREGEDDESK